MSALYRPSTLCLIIHYCSNISGIMSLNVRKEERVVMRGTDEESWKNILAKSESHLVIVDCYQDWSGTCDALQPILQRQFMEYMDADDRLALAAASITQIGALIQAALPSDTHTKIEAQTSCTPLYLLLRNSTCLVVVHGVDAPTLLQHISNNIPERKVPDE